jgi:hypothetical protein
MDYFTRHLGVCPSLSLVIHARLLWSLEVRKMPLLWLGFTVELWLSSRKASLLL